MDYVIDGLFITQRINGVQRYAYELCKELDKLIGKDELEMLVPESTDIFPDFNNIKIVRYGKHSGKIWQQIDLRNYLKKKKKKGIFLTNTFPIMYPRGVVTIHDVIFKAYPKYFTSDGKIISVIYRRLQYWLATHSKMKIITVSEFSKSEIMKYYGVPQNKIYVIYNAWQHMERVQETETTFDRYDMLKPNEYYFSLSTMAPHKNLKWILRIAKNNQDKIFAIGGGGLMNNSELEEFKDLSNIHFLGYVSDEDAKTLMGNCKAFLFPTLYEGFGIPPLEAIACGTKRIIVSDIPCLREIYGDVAQYISPYDYMIELQENDLVDDKELKNLLSKYSWRKSAKKLYEILYSDI